MAWTAPRTWVTGEVVTAALFNTHLRDNQNAISTHGHSGSGGDGGTALGNLVQEKFADAAPVSAPGSGLTTIYTVSGVPHMRAGAGGADTEISIAGHVHTPQSDGSSSLQGPAGQNTTSAEPEFEFTKIGTDDEFTLDSSTIPTFSGGNRTCFIGCSTVWGNSASISETLRVAIDINSVEVAFANRSMPARASSNKAKPQQELLSHVEENCVSGQTIDWRADPTSGSVSTYLTYGNVIFAEVFTNS